MKPEDGFAPGWLTYAEAKVAVRRAFDERPGAVLQRYSADPNVSCNFVGRIAGLTVHVSLQNLDSLSDPAGRAAVSFLVEEWSVNTTFQAQDFEQAQYRRGSLADLQPCTLALLDMFLSRLDELHFVYSPTYAGGVLIHARLVAVCAGVEMVQWSERILGQTAAVARLQQPWVTHTLPVPIDTGHFVGCSCTRCAARIRAGSAGVAVSRSTDLLPEESGAHLSDGRRSVVAGVGAGAGAGAGEGAGAGRPDEAWPSVAEAKATILREFSEHPRARAVSYRQEPGAEFSFHFYDEYVDFTLNIRGAGGGSDADAPAEIEYNSAAFKIRETVTQGDMLFSEVCSLVRHVQRMHFVYIPTYVGDTLHSARLLGRCPGVQLTLFDRELAVSGDGGQTRSPAVTYHLPLPLLQEPRQKPDRRHWVGCACAACARLIREQFPDLRVS